MSLYSFIEIMRNFMTALCVLAMPVMAVAQIHYPDSKNPDILRHMERVEPYRQEMILPQVNGYNVYKADLHTHTLFSDGSVMPEFRVQEAWEDGLDILAITDHIESRKSEEIFVEYLQKYVSDEYPKALNTFIALEPTPKGSIMVDLNFSYNLAKKAADKYGLLVIRGAEISRCGATIGHFNALFTKDNNEIYDPDPLTCIRNAKAQNALVMHNHPGYRRTSIDYSEVEKAAYDEGLFDGVEVMNGSAFYPGIIDRVQDRGLFIAACTDIHAGASTKYRSCGMTRPMTLILAKDKSEKAVREALEARRTLAWGFETLCGEEQLLKDFFAAGMKVEVLRKSSSGTEVALTNLTSVPYIIQRDGANWQRLNPFTTLRIKAGKGESSLKFKVLNMFCRSDRNPEVELKF